MLTLRTYQEDMIKQIRQSFRTGHKRILSVLPCGAGKTICFAYMAENHILKNPKNKVWFLVHRQELIEQTIDSFKRFGINMNNIFVGMVQSVSRHIEKYGEPTLIIFDEAHHATAKTWTNIIDAFPGVPVIGLTATPCRLNGDSLGLIFDDMKVGVNTQYLLSHNYLSKFEYYAPKINYMIPKIVGSDYDVSTMEYESRIYGDVLNYIDLNRKIIIYCPNIQFSRNLEQEINERFGNVAVHFDGTTPDGERKQIIRDFRDGKIKMLLNVDLIGEGFDVPDCDCVMLLRPTQSTALFIQQSMRCMRYKEGKTAVIYDFVGNAYRHGLPDEDREWSLEKKVRCRNSNSMPDILSRMCEKCYRVYSGINRICPYCGNDNGKTKKQIEEEKQAELEHIEKVERRKKRMEVGMCNDYEQLVKIGIERGYKNPRYWAKTIIESRQNKNTFR